MHDYAVTIGISLTIIIWHLNDPLENLKL